MAALPPTTLAALVGALTFVLTVIGATVIAHLADSVLSRGRAVSIDVRAQHWFVTHRVAWLTTLTKVLTNLGAGPVIAAVVMAVAVTSVAARRRRDAAFVLAATAGAALAALLIKALVARARPAGIDQLVHVTGAAFPSGHATQATACYGAVACIVTRRSGRLVVSAVAWALAALGAFTVGLSRVYLGVHWLSDVVAGWALGATWLAALVAAQSGYRLLRCLPSLRPKRQAGAW